MTPTEFKAWFDGFTEALSGVPTEAQWARIKARVAEIDGRPITQQVYVDRYWPSWPQRIYDNYHKRWSDDHRVWMSAGTPEHKVTSGGSSADVFDGINAMYAAGRNDAVTMAGS